MGEHIPTPCFLSGVSRALSPPELPRVVNWIPRRFALPHRPPNKTFNTSQSFARPEGLYERRRWCPDLGLE
jgi:hypothetical protein